MKLEKLKEQYNLVCEEYIKHFCKKQEYEFSGWVMDHVGGVAIFIEQYFFSLDDIVTDINFNCPKGLIFEWQDDNVEADEPINYWSYAKNGLRVNKKSLEIPFSRDEE